MFLPMSVALIRVVEEISRLHFSITQGMFLPEVTVDKERMSLERVPDSSPRGSAGC